MPRPSKLELETWGPESEATLKSLREECNKRNAESTFDANNQKTSYHVVKGESADGSPRFYIVARKYTKKVKTPTDCCPETKKKILELKASGMSISKISKEVNLSHYKVNKIITSI